LKEPIMKTNNARLVPRKHYHVLILIATVLIAAAMIVVPVYSARSGLLTRDGMGARLNARKSAKLITARTTAQPTSSPETIATFAADCTTAKSTFFVGETVCAKTDSVTPTDGSWWVNWILLPSTVVNGGDHVNPVTTNPQTFTYAPTTAGSYKVSLSNVPGDISQTPAGFTVIPAPTLGTYSGDCTTAKSDFNLGQTICIKVSGLSNTEFPQRRVQLAEPDGFVLQRFNVTDNSQTFSYTIPSANTENFAGETIDHRGTWVVALIDPDADLNLAVPVVVHKSNLLVDRVADLQVAKFLIDTGDPPTAGQDVSFQIFLTNQGPDPATSVTLKDFTLPNTTFQSFTRNAAVMASNLPPRSLLRPYLPENMMSMMSETNDMRLTFDPRSMLLVEDTPATFNCVSPAAGSAGTTTCTADADIAPGETAAFTAVYHISDSLPNGAQLSDDQSATVSSSTTDPRTASNSSNTTIGAGNTNPPTCTLSCPGNITAVADTTGPGVDQNGDPATVPGANVTFSPSTSGTCGTVTSNPASGSFFPVGSTPVSISTSDGASCDFIVTVTTSGSAVTISCPAAKTANAGPNCDATVSLGTPTTTGDNVTVTGTRSDSKPLTSPFPVGVTTVHWVASSSSGGDSCDQQVTVNDVTPPTITAVSQTVSAGSSCQAVIPDYHNSANDNCACASDDNSEICQTRDDILVTQDVAAGTSVGLGTTTIHLTATDEANNTSTKTITFTVVDTTAPTFTFVPAAITANTGAGATTCDTTVNPGTATASDNCGPVTITRSPSGNTFPVGTTTITWTAKDGANNTTTATQTITVIDNTPPVITLNGQTPSMWPPNHKYSTFTVGNFVSSVFDNCGGVSVSNVVITNVTSDETENGNGDGNTTADIVIAADCKSVQLRSERDGGGDGRVYTITFRLTDTHGNSTTATAKVVVPHNPGETPVNSGVHYSVNSSCP
jgi:uncharacterized repeat protein (TIGR01451 family)